MKPKQSIKIKAYAKINLSLDVGEVMPNGMHPVDMIMQQISLCDEVEVSLVENEVRETGVSLAEKERKEIDASSLDNEGTEVDARIDKIILTCDNPELPTDSGNLAYRAAEKMLMLVNEKASTEDDVSADCKENIYKTENPYGVYIDIKKNIPLAAGLAGGSSNAAAVIHGLNALFNMNLGLNELCEIGAELGSDVPFCILGQAAANENLPEEVRSDKLATTAARATGTGTTLTPCTPLNAAILLAKPEIGVSTKEVYQGIDRFFEESKTKGISVSRPDNAAFEKALKERNIDVIKDNMINLLEHYTLATYPEVAALKEELKNRFPSADKILMSGSGPTIYAVYIEGETIDPISECNVFSNCEIHYAKAI